MVLFMCARNISGHSLRLFMGAYRFCAALVLVVSFFVMLGCSQSGGGTEGSNPIDITKAQVTTQINLKSGEPVAGARVTSNNGVSGETRADGSVLFQVGLKLGEALTLVVVLPGGSSDNFMFDSLLPDTESVNIVLSVNPDNTIDVQGIEIKLKGLNSETSAASGTSDPINNGDDSDEGSSDDENKSGSNGGGSGASSSSSTSSSGQGAETPPGDPPEGSIPGGAGGGGSVPPPGGGGGDPPPEGGGTPPSLGDDDDGGAEGIENGSGGGTPPSGPPGGPGGPTSP